jgi:hypothetical protein
MNMKFFEYGHLPENLQEISKPIGVLAGQLDNQLSDCTEKDIGMRKLLEAKDCFVRAKLDENGTKTSTDNPESKKPTIDSRGFLLLDDFSTSNKTIDGSEIQNVVVSKDRAIFYLKDGHNFVLTAGLNLEPSKLSAKLIRSWGLEK